MLRVKNVSYTYFTKFQKVEALKNITFEFLSGKMYALTGESGSGKSTLLSLIAGLDLPTEGDIFFHEQNLRKMNLDRYRKEDVSVIYQNYNLFPLLTGIENVMVPLKILKKDNREAMEAARRCLSQAGISDSVAKKLPKMMSGGEQQRIAIARAISSGGKLLLADEPTGNLDSENEAKIIDLMKSLAHEKEYAVIIATHSQVVAQEADEILILKDGRLIAGSDESVSRKKWRFRHMNQKR